MKFAYVGSFTTPERGGLGSGGISVFTQSAESAPWRPVQVIERMNPSFLAFHQEKDVLYAAQGDGCTLAAFRIHPESGELSLLNERHIGLYNSVSVVVDPTGQYLLAACLNNGSGAILSLRLKADGAIGEICDIEVPQGRHGPLNSQPASQPHQVIFDPEGTHLIVCDKGLDCIHAYRLDRRTGEFLWTADSQFPTSCCPRHVVFHPNGRYAYLLAEWIDGVFPCTYENGTFTPMEWHKTAPLDYTGFRNIGAEIAVHPSGRFLYASNRGYSSIVSFAIQDDGRLKALDWCREGVAKPRYFTLSPSGEHLYCANEETHSVTVYSVCPHTGGLTLLHTAMSASAPACVIFR